MLISFVPTQKHNLLLSCDHLCVSQNYINLLIQWQKYYIWFIHDIKNWESLSFFFFFCPLIHGNWKKEIVEHIGNVCKLCTIPVKANMPNYTCTFFFPFQFFFLQVRWGRSTSKFLQPNLLNKIDFLFFSTLLSGFKVRLHSLHSTTQASSFWPFHDSHPLAWRDEHTVLKEK